MKKKIIFFIYFTAIYFTCFCQTKKITLLDKEMGAIYFKYMKYVDLEKEDTSYLTWVGFRNAKYTSIVDIESIAFDNENDFLKFIKDFNAALKQIESGENVSISWERPDYTIRIREGDKGLFLYSENARGYIWLNKKYTIKLLEQLERVTFGEDVLKPESK